MPVGDVEGVHAVERGRHGADLFRRRDTPHGVLHVVLAHDFEQSRAGP